MNGVLVFDEARPAASSTPNKQRKILKCTRSKKKAHVQDVYEFELIHLAGELKIGWNQDMNQKANRILTGSL